MKGVMAFLGITLGLIVGFLMAVLSIIMPFAGDPRLDIYWGLPDSVVYLYFGRRSVVPENVAVVVFVVGMPAWWALLFYAAFARLRRVAFVLFFAHILSGPLARYLFMGEAPKYLMELNDPNLWLRWLPMAVFTAWYFTVAFNIRWRRVARSAWMRVHG